MLKTARLRLRSWATADLDALVRLADSPAVARNLRDRFPSPYTRADGEAWLELCAGELQQQNWAIECDGEVVGGIGLAARGDVQRLSAEIGYWLGEPYWGRGIATEALLLLSEHVLATRDLVRLDAYVFAWNGASARVLEKAGYVKEGVLRKAVIKGGELCDAWVYARVKEG